MINTTLCYIYRGDEVLMLHRTKKKNDLNHDKWIGLGGKFEDRESPEDCVIREVREETGLTLTSYRYRGIVTFVNDRYETECDEGEPAWIPRERLDELPQWEGDRIFLKLLDEGAPFFSLKLVYEGDALREAVLNGKKIR